VFATISRDWRLPQRSGDSRLRRCLARGECARQQFDILPVLELFEPPVRRVVQTDCPGRERPTPTCWGKGYPEHHHRVCTMQNRIIVRLPQRRSLTDAMVPTSVTRDRATADSRVGGVRR
jgi:hypothetical protein